MSSGPLVRYLGCQPYLETYQRMRAFTKQRADGERDQIWLLEHEPVFTQGRAGKQEHVIAAGDIPVVQTDRGGQVTYHGPGQITAYLLLDIRRLGLDVRSFVSVIENSMIAFLAELDIDASARKDAPGVYVAGKKIGSLGLRVSRGFTYHGLNLNVDMDMEPWQRVNPCGLGVAMTQVSEHVSKLAPMSQLQSMLANILQQQLGYNLAT